MQDKLKYYILKIPTWPIFFIKWSKFKFYQVNLQHFKNVSQQIEQIDDYQNTDQWLLALEQAFLSASHLYQDILPKQLPKSIVKLGLCRSYIEFQAKILEENVLFENLTLSDSFRGRKVLVRPFKCHSTFIPKTKVHVLSFIDLLINWKNTQWHLLKKMIFAIFSISKPKRHLEHEGCIRGLSLSEMPNIPNGLNCFWADDIKTLDFFYFTSHENKEQFKSKTNTPVYSHVDLLQSLPVYAKLYLFFEMFILFFKNFFIFNLDCFFISSHFYDAFVWNQFAKTRSKNLKWVLTSISECWPSPVEFEVLAQQNVKTLLWAYSFYGLRMSTNSLLKDRNLLLSFSHFTDIIMWNETSARTIKNNEIQLKNFPILKNYHLSGPCLNNSKKHFEMTSQEARSHIHLGHHQDSTIISFFDLMAWNSPHRRAAGLGFYMPEFVQEQFYQSIIQLLSQDQKLIAVIKPKRSQSFQFYFPPSLELILNKKISDDLMKRIILLEENVDPVLVIKASDLVVCSTFTSPAILAQQLGIPGVYYDPSKTFQFINSEKIQKMIVQSQHDLLDQIEKVRNHTFNFSLETFPNKLEILLATITK